MSETAEQPRLVLMEIWRPLRYVGSRGPGVFWREWLVAGFKPDREPIWQKPAPWRVMAVEFYRKLRTLPNNYYTDDDHPGVTFLWRKMHDPQFDDFEQVKRLRAGSK